MTMVSVLKVEAPRGDVGFKRKGLESGPQASGNIFEGDCGKHTWPLTFLL